MNGGDPFSLAAAWGLCILSLTFALGALRARAQQHAKAGERYTTGRRIGDVLLPLGFGAFGARMLLLGYGVLSETGGASRLLYLLAVLSIIGGVAGSRIRRMP